ncbi:uncharacterized protein N7496_009627 [Penicillium cataractarum]|uniref:Uncharacterized protein n=1 Tax=Penicillium cataractarum TaxID=2100454 RepID=A0A9W9RRG6_9EURO|nr:uncharacterized protein N7496_009627 [Penicillium cataractarum]KAJ5363914.1 hypothetical protein N7496_009627 [Penicillium cataractarum]
MTSSTTNPTSFVCNDSSPTKRPDPGYHLLQTLPTLTWLFFLVVPPARSLQRQLDSADSYHSHSTLSQGQHIQRPLGTSLQG